MEMNIKMKRTGIPAAILLLSAMLSGCSLGDYRQTRYYDLQTPEPLNKMAVQVEIGAFQNNTAVRQRMCFRTASGEILVDEYNKFVQPPDMMIGRYLAIAFGNQPESAPGAPVLKIRGTIFLFEFDVEKSEARCGVEYVIELRRADGTGKIVGTGSEIFRAQSLNREPDVVARAFSRCSFQLAGAVYAAAEKAATAEQQ